MAKFGRRGKAIKNFLLKNVYVRLDILEQLLLLRLYRFSFLFFSFSIVVLIVKLFLRLHSLCVLPSVTFWKKIMMMIPVTWIQNEYLHSTKIGYWCRRQLKNQWELPNCRWKSMEIKVDIIKMGHFVCPICNSNSKQISISLLRKLHRLDEWWFLLTFTYSSFLKWLAVVESDLEIDKWSEKFESMTLFTNGWKLIFLQ